MHRKRFRGFTLIELMIVVAIIAVIAALAIPNLLGARKSGNEASAISSLRTITTVNEQYRTRFGSYAGTMNNLLATGYIDQVLGNSSKSGYDFFYAGGISTWLCFGNPRSPGGTGDRYFYVNHSGVIRFNTTALASASDPPID